MAETTPKVQVTKNYRLFIRSQDNRPVDEKKHRRLRHSMSQYGFLEAFPIVCVRDSDKHLVVKDGQHRLMFAETLGLPVYYIVTAQQFSTADINSTSKVWTIADYAKNFADNGKVQYFELLKFQEVHGIPLGTCAAMLSGTTTFSNISDAFMQGAFHIKDRKWAHKVASVYKPLVTMNKRLRSNRLIEACMAVCRVEAFDITRLCQNAERCREKLVPYSTRDAYLDMLEDVYNFGRKSLLGLKAASIMAMRERSAVTKNGK
jgi:hypothetical protein